MSRTLAVVCTLAAGALVGLQPPANAALAEHVGDLGAALVSLAISLAIIGVLLLVLGHPGRLTGLSGFRPELTLGGLGGAAVVGVALATVRPLGAGVVVALLVAGQVVVSLLVDQFGWFGLHQIGIGPLRIVGMLLVVGGTVMVTRG